MEKYLARRRDEMLRQVIVFCCVLVCCEAQAQPTIQGSGLFIVGQRKSLACTVTTDEVTSSFPLYWTSDKSVGVLPPESQQTIPVSTTITSFNTYYTFDVAATNNREVFTCTSNLNSGGAATWTIYVYQPPQTPVITGPIVVQSGAESVWTCVVDGASSSSPSVDWNFGNGTRVSSSLYANDPLVYTDANALEIHKVTSTLTLTPPVSQPNFDLFCVAAHFDTSTEKRGQVSVTVQYPPVIGGGALNITVTTGIDYKIDCQISASPAFTAVTWYKDGVALTPGGRYVGGTVASPDLIINGWTKADAGGYLCRVSNSVGTTDGPLNTFTVRYLPIISYPQNPVGGVVNSDLALPCLIDAVPAHTTVRWYSVNSVSGVETEILPNNNPTKYSGGNALTPALTVLDLSTSDAGLYLCKADNNVGRGTGTTLMVQVTYPPTINVTNTPYDVNLGSSVTIPCDYDAFPSATSVSWTKNSVPLSLPSADGRLTGGSIATPGLTIANLQVLDTAVFRCEVVSPLGSATSPNISLGVVYAPVVSTPVTSYNGSLGSDVTLACSAVAYPPVFLLLWYKDGQVLNLELPYAGKYSVVFRTSPSLTIYNSTAGDSGNYTCHARNQEGRADGDVISFNVIYAPIMTADTTSYTGNVSQPVTLSCLYDAFPPVTSVVWTKGSQTIDVTNSGGRYTGSTLATPSLTINNVTEGDAGSYTCNAVNSIGTGRSNAIALAVNYPPRVTTDRTFLRASETQSAVLTCSYQAAPAPTTLQWLRNGDVIDTADVTKYSGGTVASPILVIQNLQKSDIGNYTCRAVNELGTGDSGKLLLDVLYAPKMSVNTTRYETEAGGTVTFSCWYDSNPAPTGIQWTKNSQVVDVVNSGGKYSGATLAIPGLTVASLTTTDAGVYVCSVTNSLGPGFTPDVALVVNCGEPYVTLQCQRDELGRISWSCFQPIQGCDFKEKSTSNITDTLRNISFSEYSVETTADIVNRTENVLSENDDIVALDVVYFADIIQQIVNQANISQETGQRILELAERFIKVNSSILQDSNSIGNATNRILTALEGTCDKIQFGNDTDVVRLISNTTSCIARKLDKVPRARRAVSPPAGSGDVVVGLELQQGGQSQHTLDEDDLVPLFENRSRNYNRTDAAIFLPGRFVRAIMDNNTGKDLRLTNVVFADTAFFRTGRLETYGQLSPNREPKLNSKVISARITVDGVEITKLYNDRVTTVFSPVDSPVESRSSQSLCVFWNPAGSQGQGAWSQDGCRHTSTLQGRDVCACDHLTNFAILLDLYGQDALPDAANQTALSVITIIGLSLSIAGLSATVLCFLLIKKLRRGRHQQTLVHMAVSMLGSWVVFLAGFTHAENGAGCIAVAAMLHYLILVSFMWMLMEGLLQYLLFVKVFGVGFEKYMLKTSAVAWGLPLIPVVTILAIDTDLYRGGDQYCWMSLIPLYYAFLAPVALIILINIVIYILVVYKICRRANIGNSGTTNRATGVRASFVCFIALGLSWTFAFFAIEDARLVFQYLFTLTSTLQGFLVFLAFTARDPSVRAYWTRLCCRCGQEPADTSKTSKTKHSQELDEKTSNAVWQCCCIKVTNPFTTVTYNVTKHARRNGYKATHNESSDCKEQETEFD